MAAFDLLINFGNNSFELSDTLNTLYFCRIHCILIWFIMIQLIVFMKWPILHKYFRELRLFSAYLIYRNKSLAYCILQIPFYLKIQKEVYTGAIFLICWVCKDNKPSDCFCLKKNVAITGTIIHIIQDIFHLVVWHPKLSLFKHSTDTHIINYLHFSKIWYNMTDWSNKLELFGRLMESGNNFRRIPFIFKILLLKTIAIELLSQSIHYKLFSTQVYDRRPIHRFKLLLKSFWQPDVMRKTRMLLVN